MRAVSDFKEHVAGEEFLFEGPGTYIPKKEVVCDELVKSIVIKAIRLRARRECVDRGGKERVTGEEWIVKKNSK